MRINLKGLNWATKRLADGTLRTYWYAWRGGPRLTGTRFAGVHRQLQRGHRRPRSAAPEGTLLSLLQGYQAEQDFSALRERTRADYIKQIKKIEQKFGDSPLQGAGRSAHARHLHGVARRARAAARSGRPTMHGRCWRVCLSWAKDRGLITVNPCEAGGRSIAAPASTSCGASTTRRRSSTCAQRICTCRCCWRCGPASAKATCCGCRGRLTTAATSGCKQSKTGARVEVRSARRSRPRSMRRHEA